MSVASGARTPWVRLALLSVAAIAIHGYHLGVEDGEIFIPAARKLLHPQLYPFATEFFQSHERLSLFSPILVGTARFLHLSMDWTVFLWYLVSLYALLTACWMLASVCFVSQRARWCSMLVLTAVLTMPATNTGLLLIDPYLTPRSFSTPLTLIALVCFLRRQYVLAALTTVITATIHPQMAAYLVFLTATMLVIEKCKPAQRERVPVLAGMTGILPASFHFGPADDPYREALYARDFYFLSNWTWYHWLGMLAPLAILAWFWKGKIRATTPEFKRLSFALIPFGLLSILVAAFFSSLALHGYFCPSPAAALFPPHHLRLHAPSGWSSRRIRRAQSFVGLGCHLSSPGGFYGIRCTANLPRQRGHRLARPEVQFQSLG